MLTALAAASIVGAVPPQPEGVRFATFNCSLNRPAAGRLVEDLAGDDDPQIAAVVEIIQRANADVLLLNEFDFDAGGDGLRLLLEHLAKPHDVTQSGDVSNPTTYAWTFQASVNTGMPTGLDLNRDGTSDGPEDAQGFGRFPGQYGMVLLSKHPIALEGVRTFQRFLWKDLPGALLPDDVDTPAPADYYSDEMVATLRLSSKSHWDVPIDIGGHVVHVLASHPTPPAFDGVENRNGRRNHDEIRFWLDYIDPDRGEFIVDDRGRRGGLESGKSFVVMGDLNSDPIDGASDSAAIRALLKHPLLDMGTAPASEGGAEAAGQGGANQRHRGPPRNDTADFNDQGPGNLRVDYVISSGSLGQVARGVFWPAADQPYATLTGVFPFPASDHRLVWVDVRAPVLAD